MILPRGTGFLVLAVVLACLPPAPLAAQVRIPISLLTGAAPADDSSTATASPSDSSAAGESAQEDKDQGKSTRKFRFVFRRYPSLRFGNWLRADFRAKIHTDFRIFDPEIHHQDDGRLFELRRMRVAVEGTAFKIFEYQVERDVRSEVSEEEFSSKHAWKDVFVNFRYFRKFQIQGGHFKLPFGMEEMTGSTHTDFIARSIASQALTPARDMGIMAHGHLFERGLHYQVGFFQHDGEGARGKNDIIAGYRTFAGRLTGTPLQLLKLPGTLQGIQFGGAFTESAVPEADPIKSGPGGLRARTYSKQTWFQDLFVHGHRLRLGGEMQWTPGPFSLKGEFIHVRDQRIGQGLMSNDLPDLIARGWYAAGTWLVTGEKKVDTIVPKRSLIPFHGLGALEIAGRYEQTRFGSSEHPGKPTRSLRAANILGNREFAWTFGANWYWNRMVRIQFNATREQIEDPVRSPFGNREPFWMKVWQLQFVM
jgi:phosphate-selective porin OprO/OprP